jgi:PhzF family phenazine biosynthesis protein
MLTLNLALSPQLSRSLQVLLEEPADAEWMAHVADEMHLSETAFLVPRPGVKQEFELRWFTPTDEVDLCGHATLAASHVLWEVHGQSKDLPLTFPTKSGTLIATIDAEGWISLDFPTEPAKAVPADSPDRAKLLIAFEGLKPEEVLFVGRNRMDLIAEVTPEAFVKLAPVPSDVKKIECRVLSVTTAGCPCPPPGRTAAEFDFTSRYFAPCVGVDEDPVCGSAHCCLGPYWAEKLGVGDAFLSARAASPRGGEMRVRCAGERTVLCGKAVTTLVGQLLHA